MTPQSRSVAIIALVLATAAHATPVFMQGSTPVEIRGGNTALASQGNSFTNMVAGTQTPEEPQDITDAPDTNETSRTPPLTPHIENQNVEPRREISKNEVVKPVGQPTKVEPLPVLTNTSQLHDPLSVDTAPALQAVQPAASVQSTDPPLLRPLLRTEQDIEQASERASVPPKPEAQSPVVEPKPQPKPEPKPRGNGANSAVQGTAEGQNNSPGGQASSKPSTAREQGNAAVSNYPGVIKRKIHRAKRQRVNIKGETLISFKIASDGTISGAHVTRSSGSARLDRIALSQVHRAAPFPPPPSGARTSYSIEIRGK